MYLSCYGSVKIRVGPCDDQSIMVVLSYVLKLRVLAPDIGTKL